MLLTIQAIAFVAAGLFAIAATAGGRLHAVVAVILAAVGYGLIAGMGVTYVLNSLRDGFAAGFATVGLFVLAGAIAARILAASGGLEALAGRLGDGLRWRRLTPITAAAGLCLGAVASAEAAFLLLAPLAGAVAKAAGLAAGRLRLLLALALGAGHTLLLPAPGPIIAAAVLSADAGLTLAFGAIAAVAAGLAAIAFAWLASARLGVLAGTDLRQSRTAAFASSPPLPPPGVWLSLLPIAVPLLLLAIANLGHLTTEPLGHGTRPLLLALGSAPAILLVAVGLAVCAARGTRRRVLSEDGWLAAAIKDAAPLAITAAAAVAFARVLQNSGLPDRAGDAVSSALFEATPLMPVLLPFAVAAALKTLQGSSLVAMISAAGIVELMLPAGDPASRALAVTAVGAGAIAVSHANDGYFWIVVRTLKLTPVQGVLTQTLGSLITASAALVAVAALRAILS